MGDIGGLQLLPTQKRRFSLFGFAGGNRLFALALLILVLLGIGYGVLKWYTSRVMVSIEGLDANLDTIHRTRDKAQEEKLTSFERQLATTQKLLASHLASVDSLYSLQKLIQPQVTFRSLSADAAKRTYEFHAVTNSYSTVAKQIAAFYRSDRVADIKLTNVQAGQHGTVEFTMGLTLKP
jgi:hypothetical protein